MPGPWKLETLGHTLRVTESTHEADNADIAVLGTCSEMNRANGRLIAAAPDMLALLQEAMRGCTQTQFQDWKTRARAIIAKAKGGAS